MRRIVTFDNVSVDGYFTSPDGKLEWVVPDDEIYKSAAATMSDIDTMLFVRRTFEMFEKSWRHAVDDSPTAPNPHDRGRRSKASRDQAVWINETNKVVFSKTLKNVTWKNSRVVRELDPREIEKMKKQSGGDMIIFGSGSIVSQLAEHGLIDEYQFIVSPTLLGAGRSLLSNVSDRMKLALLEAKKFKSGNVVLRYAPADGGA